MDYKERSQSFRRYLKYVFQRAHYFSIGVLTASDNQVYFYCNLSRELKGYLLKTNAVFCKYLLGIYDYKQAMEKLNIDDNRKFFRKFKTFREKAITEIENIEDRLLLQYPFDFTENAEYIYKNNNYILVG